MKAIVNPQKCIYCKSCVVAKECPVKAVFRLADDEAAVIDMDLCHGCGLCVSKCPAHAVVVKEG
jgi:Pyruvate/2-oxoacid:ferredoxin oxidoreductase delta subunit